jgi:predicted dehydrogenase
MMASGALDVEALISHRFAFGDALEAYSLLGSDEASMGILLEYSGIGDGDDLGRTVVLGEAAELVDMNIHTTSALEAVVGFIGAGSYVGQVLIPAFKGGGAVLHTVASSGGVSGVHYGKKYGFEQTTTDAASVFADADINTVVVATRHDSHSGFVVDALQAGKHVFVEKPLCLTLDELDEISSAYKESSSLLMVGFNRRFAPHVQKIKQLLSGMAEPKSFIMTVNAGGIPADHWTQDPDIGGGRIIGEACHFIDLLRFLAGAAIVSHSAIFMGTRTGMVTNDKVSISLSFADGSFGTVHYLANGSKAFPKERLEVFCAGGVLQLNNFRRLSGFGWPGFKKMNLRRQDKGQKACASAFLDAVREGADSPIPFDEIDEVSRISIEIACR